MDAAFISCDMTFDQISAAYNSLFKKYTDLALENKTLDALILLYQLNYNALMAKVVNFPICVSKNVSEESALNKRGDNGLFKLCDAVSLKTNQLGTIRAILAQSKYDYLRSVLATTK